RAAPAPRPAFSWHRADEPAAHRQGSQGARDRGQSAGRDPDHAHRGRLSAAGERKQPVMPRRLIVLNVVLGLASLVLAVGIVRALLVKQPIPPSPTVRTVTPVPPPAAALVPQNPAEYTIITDQNLFNPARSEKATIAVAVVKPILHGIVIEGTKSRAFLEDPTVKRVGAYSVGDVVSGGTLQKIADDRVVISRPEGLVEVMLQDPSKPKPASVAAAGPPVTAAPRAAPPEGIP